MTSISCNPAFPHIVLPSRRCAYEIKRSSWHYLEITLPVAQQGEKMLIILLFSESLKGLIMECSVDLFEILICLAKVMAYKIDYSSYNVRVMLH